MKQLFYTFRYLLRGKGNNFIKITSLTIGLVVSIILFSQVAFEMSYDNFFPEKENLYMLQVKWELKEGDLSENFSVFSPFAPTMNYEFEEVESATVRMNGSREMVFTVGEQHFTETEITADSLFFSTLGIQLSVINPNMLIPNSLVISQSFAKRAFGDEDPVGKTIMKDGNSMIIAGVFADIPKNSHFKFDVVNIFSPSLSRWQGNDAYYAYIRLKPGIDPRAVDAKIPEMMRKHYDVDAELEAGINKTFSLYPLTQYHSGNKDVQRTCLVLSLLAFVLLFAAAMNYILISISSLVRRAKIVGIHKCNGAMNKNIFTMFMNETSMLIFISLLISLLIFLVFRGQIETLIKTPLNAIFTINSLWVVAAILVILFLVTGFIPAKIFSSIPVTQIFHTYADNKKQWKRGLLFAQFSGIAFIITLLVIIVSQYHLMLNKDLGYNMDNLLYTKQMWKMPDEQRQTVKEELMRFPEVKSVSLSSDLPITWFSGDPVKDPETKENLFVGYLTSIDENYLETYKMELTEGRNFTKQSANMQEVIVNQTLVSKLNLKNPVGEKIFYLGAPRIICGVIKDFQYQSFYEGARPIIMVPDATHEYFPTNRFTVKLNVPLTTELTTKLSGKLKELAKDEEVSFTSYIETYNAYYADTYSFRNAISVAASLMLVMTLIGLFGFVDDEVSRRKKEIAIRKISGAQVKDILTLLSKGICYIAIPSILLGLLFSYMIGAEWLQQFAVKVPLNIILFTLSGMFILSLVIFSVITRAWRVANENPVNSIKSE